MSPAAHAPTAPTAGCDTAIPFISHEQKKKKKNPSFFKWSLLALLIHHFENHNISFSNPQFPPVWNTMDEFLWRPLRVMMQKWMRYRIGFSMLWFLSLASIPKPEMLRFSEAPWVCALDVSRAPPFNWPCVGGGGGVLFMENTSQMFSLCFAEPAVLSLPCTHPTHLARIPCQHNWPLCWSFPLRVSGEIPLVFLFSKHSFRKHETQEGIKKIFLMQGNITKDTCCRQSQCCSN